MAKIMEDGPTTQLTTPITTLSGFLLHPKKEKEKKETKTFVVSLTTDETSSAFTCFDSPLSVSRHAFQPPGF